jgi:hypothetical protein
LRARVGRFLRGPGPLAISISLAILGYGVTVGVFVASVLATGALMGFGLGISWSFWLRSSERLAGPPPSPPARCMGGPLDGAFLPLPPGAPLMDWVQVNGDFYQRADGEGHGGEIVYVHAPEGPE